MRWCPSFLLFCFLAVVHGLSSAGNRLAVVLEDAAEQELYSSFWGDLQGRFGVKHCGIEDGIGVVLMIV